MKVEKSGGMTIGGVIEGERLKVVGQGCSAKAAASTGLAFTFLRGCEEQYEHMLWPVRLKKC